MAERERADLFEKPAPVSKGEISESLWRWLRWCFVDPALNGVKHGDGFGYALQQRVRARKRPQSASKL